MVICDMIKKTNKTLVRLIKKRKKNTENKPTTHIGNERGDIAIDVIVIKK